MANVLSIISLYPALDKLFNDVVGYWSGKTREDRQRILSHRLDEAEKQFTRISELMDDLSRINRQYHSARKDQEVQTEVSVPFDPSSEEAFHLSNAYFLERPVPTGSSSLHIPRSPSRPIPLKGSVSPEYAYSYSASGSHPSSYACDGSSDEELEDVDRLVALITGSPPETKPEAPAQVKPEEEPPLPDLSEQEPQAVQYSSPVSLKVLVNPEGPVGAHVLEEAQLTLASEVGPPLEEETLETPNSEEDLHSPLYLANVPL